MGIVMDPDNFPCRCCACGAGVLPSAVLVEADGSLPAVYMCHHCRRQKENAVPGGKAARDADRVEQAALADLLALRDELA